MFESQIRICAPRGIIFEYVIRTPEARPLRGMQFIGGLSPKGDAKNVPAIPASQRTVQRGGQTEDGAAGSYNNPYTRDEAGPVVPPCLENSALTFIAQRPRTYMHRAAPAHIHSAHAAYQLLEHRMHTHNPPTP